MYIYNILYVAICNNIIHIYKVKPMGNEGNCRKYQQIIFQGHSRLFTGFDHIIVDIS